MGGDSGSGSGSGWGSGGGDSGMNQGGQYGGGGSGGQGGSWGGNNYNNQYSSWAAPTTTYQAPSCPSCPAQTCPPPMKETMTETTTVTAVSPCMGSTVTAYVTQWMNAPPGCWCGAGSPPPMASGWEWGGMGNAAVFTSSNPSFTPGLSSIPASEAIKTGVTVAGAPPAAAPTAAVSPGGFFGQSSSSAMTTSGTESSGPSSSVPSNMAEPTKTGEAPKPEGSSSTTSTSSSSAAAAATTTTTSSASTNSTTTSKSSSSSSSTTTTISSSSESSASAEAASATSGGFPVGSFNTIDPATLTLKNAYTLGIGRRAPVPTLLS
ncbi:uncharacterized protein Z519_01146 [Cladophialophora bantiana CBS 173.52]|uniref:Uncharacterized protein n=1 Tax=Cladophialophora bantiana (strain ATCC 10958 / CBS 173.52 / CDC B-1940 / NIH 8579) TaxID=1442370 RepID=A0A0D2GGV3_CLAB1|nr:uncharacterized protein Z519_01146 [Cladophialophora bantiana CBS 173.52]KIW97562.1 hypothetical protein Z519_01146 [Cladophialophora bantiana CBS 173.52]